MSIGPLRRSTAALALLALAPLAAMLAAGSVTPVDAAWRGVVTVVTVLTLGRMASWGLSHAATAVERAAEPADAPEAPPVREPAARS